MDAVRPIDMGFVDADTTLAERGLFIDGSPVDATSDETFKTVNPATNRMICEIQQASQADVDRAVNAAQQAFKIWSRMPASERSRILLRAAEIARDRNMEIARLETLDTGKVISETSTIDVITGAEVLEFFAGIAPDIHGEHFSHPPSGFSMVCREPLGVCAGIGAWNYPIQIAMWKSAPALACGNAVVFKPAELTPLTTQVLAQIYMEAGMPPGVFNVVQGDGRVGSMLSRHPGIAKISLTGEAETGKIVMADAATTLKHVTFELGGKSPLIIFDDCDLESAVEASMSANFYSTGQVCSNATRVFVQRSCCGEFIKMLKPRVERLKVGDPFDPESRVGPLMSRQHYEKVMGYMQDAFDSAARHVTGGKRPQDDTLKDGNYVAPAVFADCTDDMVFVREEIFGPLMAVLPFDSEEEAIARANDTRFGLSGGVFTSDFSRAHRVASAIQAGSVWINDYHTLPPELPFGGYKHSGIGRENSRHAVEAYTQVKMIYANLGKHESGL